MSAEQYFDYLLLLNRRLIACGPFDRIFNSENLSRTFGKNQSIFEEATALSARTRSGMN